MCGAKIMTSIEQKTERHVLMENNTELTMKHFKIGDDGDEDHSNVIFHPFVASKREWRLKNIKLMRFISKLFI